MSTHIASRANALQTMATRMGEKLPPTGYTSRRALQAEVAKLHASTAALDAMRSNPDPTITPAANAKRVIAAASKLADQASASRDRLHRIMQDGGAALDKQIAAKVNLKPDSFAAEIRASFRLMPVVKQHQVLADLALKNRGPELAALIDVPGILTGLDDAIRGRYRDLIISTHARDEHAELTDLMDAFLEALDAVPVAAAAAHALSDPTKLAEIERAEAAAAAAAAAFDSASAA